MNIPQLYANILRWNVAFCVPVPDDSYEQMVSLLEEEYNEYTTATSKEERLDALGDMMVVTLGICARLVIMPTVVKNIIELANTGKQEIKVDMYIMTDVVNAIRGNYNQAKALSELVTILDCVITASGNDTDAVVGKIMEHNWRKTWTAEEVKNLGPEYQVVEPLKGYVVKKAGKVQKPPSFKHPQGLAKLNPAYETATHGIEFSPQVEIKVGPPPKPLTDLSETPLKSLPKKEGIGVPEVVTYKPTPEKPASAEVKPVLKA